MQPQEEALRSTQACPSTMCYHGRVISFLGEIGMEGGAGGKEMGEGGL